MIDQSGGGGIGKAAQDLMQEMQKAQQDLQRTQSKPGSDSFQQHLQQARDVQASQQVQGVQGAQPTTQANNVLMQAKAQQIQPSTKVHEAAKAQRSHMADMLEKLIGGQDKMTQIMKLALSGKQFSSSELLALQAGVYRFSQELDLTGKVVEKATSGIKQTMNTQV